MSNNRKGFPEEFVRKIVLDSLDIENESGFVKLQEKHKKYAVTIEDIKSWRKEYFSFAFATMQRLNNPLEEGVPDNLTEKINHLKKAFIEKAPVLFTDHNDYCRSFYESSYVTDEIKDKTTENILIDYEGLNYIRYMKLFKPSNERKFPDFKFDKPLPDDTEVRIKDSINAPFHLRYYLPKSLITHKDNKTFRTKNRLVIMLNGLNEDMRFDVYDILGEYFANNGMAAVLLPTPLNLNRRLHEKHTMEKNGKPTRTLPTDWAEQCPPLFYYSFLKSFDELNELVQKINPHNIKENENFHKQWKEDDQVDRAFYRKHFWKDESDPSPTEIILLGYSLGGLKAFSFFTHSPLKYRCCITLNSGPNLFKARAKVLNVATKTWTEMLTKAQTSVKDYKEVQEWEKHSNLVKNNRHGKKSTSKAEIIELRNIFLTMYFDKPRESVKKKIAKEENHIISRYLAINSGSDKIVSINQWKQIAPKDKHIHQLIVAGVDHNLIIDQNWNEVLPQVEENILRFINSCIHEHYKRQDISDEMYKLLRVLDSFEKDKEKFINFEIEYKQNFSNDDFNKLVQKIRDAEKNGKYIVSNIESVDDDISAHTSKVEEFLDLYYCSKGFYINFSELYNKILRDAKRKIS